MNAALSFGYTLLVNEVHAGILARGLEPTLGILHPPRGTRPSLALDLVEPLRHAIIDRLVLRASNRRELCASDFERCTEEAIDAGDDPRGEAGTVLDDASGPDSPHLGEHRQTETIAESGFRFTNEGRARFLHLYHAAMDAPVAIAAGEGAQPWQGRTRDLIARAIVSYELELTTACATDQLKREAQDSHRCVGADEGRAKLHPQRECASQSHEGEVVP